VDDSLDDKNRALYDFMQRRGLTESGMDNLLNTLKWSPFGLDVTSSVHVLKEARKVQSYLLIDSFF
jgi:uncharacterized membrane protein (DUF2068 family)